MAYGRTISVPTQDMHLHLRGYQAQGLPEYSNSKRHVYWARAMGQYITVRTDGPGKLEFDFTADCPCTYDD